MSALAALIDAYASALEVHIYDESAGEKIPAKEFEMLAEAREELNWRPWDGEYAKMFYDVWVKGGDVVQQCWPNAGVMCAMDGSGRQWKPAPDVAIRKSQWQGKPPTFPVAS
jgi:hypothetical protein